MSLDLTDDKSTLVQVMAWCRQVTSHYLSQCSPRSLSPNGVTRPQWVKMSLQNGVHFGQVAKFKIITKLFWLNQSLNLINADNVTIHPTSDGLNSLAPGKFVWNFRHVPVIFKQILVIDGWGNCCEIALLWMSLDFIDDQSTLVKVMAWWRQATSHYLSQYWQRSQSPYGVTRPQWVNSLRPDEAHIYG